MGNDQSTNREGQLVDPHGEQQRHSEVPFPHVVEAIDDVRRGLSSSPQDPANRYFE